MKFVGHYNFIQLRVTTFNVYDKDFTNSRPEREYTVETKGGHVLKRIPLGATLSLAHAWAQHFEKGVAELVKADTPRVAS